MMKFKKMLYILSAVLVFPLANLAVASEDERQPAAQESLQADSGQELQQQLDQLLGLLQKRLELMNDVAKWKWNNTYPIEDLSREKAMLETVAKQAEELGLNPDQAKEIFQAQFNAAKIVQINAFEKWVEADVDLVDNAPDLNTDLRPQIDNINKEIMQQLAVVLPKLEKQDISQALKEKAAAVIAGEQIDDSVRDTALEPFLMAGQTQHMVQNP
ncbi:MAG: hypothetical protein Tsb0015_02100 [Simkaniaceae bacterium]